MILWGTSQKIWSQWNVEMPYETCSTWFLGIHGISKDAEFVWTKTCLETFPTKLWSINTYDFTNKVWASVGFCVVTVLCLSQHILTSADLSDLTIDVWILGFWKCGIPKSPWVSMLKWSNDWMICGCPNDLGNLQWFKQRQPDHFIVLTNRRVQ